MPLFFSKKARTVDGFLKVLGFVFFIFLGYVLRRTHILKEDTVHALSGLLLYVTLPCLILRSLNGLTFELSYLWLIALGLLTNIFMVVIGYFLGKGDPQKKFFCMLNLSGFNIGTFAMPFLQSFVSPLGFLSVCLFDIGNSIMCTGTTYAIASGTGKGWTLIKTILARMLSSGPICSYIVMFTLAFIGCSFPPLIEDWAKVGAEANTFLAMILLGQSIKLNIPAEQIKIILRLLVIRLVGSAIMSLALYFLLPFPEEIRRTLAILAWAPVPVVALIFSIKAKCQPAMAANLNSISVACSVIIVSILLTFH